MEAYLCRGRYIVNLKYDWLRDDVIRWRCGQLLSRDFMVYKMKPSGRASDFGYTLGRFQNFGL